MSNSEWWIYDNGEDPKPAFDPQYMDNGKPNHGEGKWTCVIEKSAYDTIQSKLDVANAEIERLKEFMGQDRWDDFKRVQDAERKLEGVLLAFENLLCEISEPSWTDELLNYEERQITKGAVDDARTFLAQFRKDSKDEPEASK